MILFRLFITKQYTIKRHNSFYLKNIIKKLFLIIVILKNKYIKCYMFYFKVCNTLREILNFKRKKDNTYKNFNKNNKM